MGYILVTKEINEKVLNSFLKKNIIHISELNYKDYDSIQLERIIPLTSIEALIGFSYIREINNPLTENEKVEYNHNRIFREKYDYLEKSILAAFNAIKSETEKYIKFGIIIDIYIFAPFVRYLIEKNHASFSFFFVTRFDDSTIFFNVLESMFPITEANFTTDEIHKMTRKLFIEKRTSTFVLSNNLYNYGESTENIKGIVFNKNYILSEFIRQNFQVDILSDQMPSYFTAGILGKLSDLPYEEKTQITYLSELTIVMRNPRYDWKPDEKYSFKLESLITNECILRICIDKYFERIDQDESGALTKISIERYCYILNRFLLRKKTRGISKDALMQIKRHYRGIKMINRLRYFYYFGGLINGYLSAHP